MVAPYWGELPPPKLHRGNSMKRTVDPELERDSLIDASSKAERYSAQSSLSRQQRHSIQTEDTQSPFASPTASSFRGDGLAPRPASYQQNAGDTTYNKDYLAKRKQREARNRELYDEAPPPAAPDAPNSSRGPPLSYKQPYSAASPSTYTDLDRTRPDHRSVASNARARGAVREYEDEGSKLGRRDSKGKAAVDRAGDYIHNRRTSIGQPSSRKGSVSEAEAQRRGEWAADRSPLQRLELTLDSITKEEKRARVEEAEQLVKEKNSGRGTEQPTQNSVRFRNRPIVKGPDPSQPDALGSPEIATARKPSARQQDNLQRNGTVERRIDSSTGAVGENSHADIESETPNGKPTLRSEAGATPQRNQSVKDKSYIPVSAAVAGATAAALGRSTSNKLKKDPPGDPWFNRRVDAERRFQEVSPRVPTSRIDPRLARDKELPSLPAQAGSKEGKYPLTSLHSDSESDEAIDLLPVRRGSTRKIEQLTGEKAISHDPKNIPTLRRGNSERDPEKTTVATHGANYAVSSGNGKNTSVKVLGHQELQKHRHFPNILHHRDDDNATGQSVYVPSRRLDEWKKGGAILLDGALLDVEAVERTEAEKDKTWWEAGNTTKRKRSMNSKQRRAEAYDGEYDDSTAPTRFKPKLFLKSGPLLRYCGLRQEKKQGRVPKDAPRPTREIWRGSVMIVTQDNESSYELAPTLRLFVQPVELLPPPPAQVDGEASELAPEYVDPIAGLPKVGRDGRTLYVRPVDHLEEARDLSKEESDDGLFESSRSPLDGPTDAKKAPFHTPHSHNSGENLGKYKEIRGFRLHTEYGVTFWKFNIEVELRENQQRIAYRINRGPATGFWVPGRNQAMNIMFHSCNGFSYGVDPNQFSGPDPMWRDVLNTHQTQPFHVMLGGGDQIYNDCVQRETELFRRWTEIPLKHQHHKEHHPFTAELQEELEKFYLNRYSMWFSQGLFGLAVSQIPMINIFDDHDIIDGFGSYSDRYMKSPVMSGLGNVAFKYYMLFQHQTSIDEGEETEPTWILGAQPGPYIHELSRSIFTFLGRSVAFLGIDCRTERMYDEVVSPETYDKVFARLMSEIKKGETKHLIVLLGVPIAYPRMVWLENILTSRLMEPVKAMSRAGLFGKKLLNHLDGGVEILDDLDDHWTAKHHKDERNFLIEELQDLAAEKSVRITILGGDVHLAAMGQFYSNPKLAIPKDRDHRYMPNIISSAIVNTPPPDALADLLNKRNKVHHLDDVTDEDMIPIFTHDVNNKPRNNKRLLNRRNWCSIREYNPDLSPPSTPEPASYHNSPSPPVKRKGLLRRLSGSKGPAYRPDVATGDRPPLSNTNFFTRRPSTTSRRGSTDSQRPGMLTRTLSLTRKDFTPSGLFRRNSKKKKDDGGINGYGAESDDEAYYDQPPQRVGMRGGAQEEDDNYFPRMPKSIGRSATHPYDEATTSTIDISPDTPRQQFHRTPTGLSVKQLKQGARPINLEGGLDICLNLEVDPKQPEGITVPYRLLVPRLWYEEEKEGVHAKKMRGVMKRWLHFARHGGEDERWRESRAEQGEHSETSLRLVSREIRGGARGL